MGSQMVTMGFAMAPMLSLKVLTNFRLSLVTGYEQILTNFNKKQTYWRRRTRSSSRTAWRLLKRGSDLLLLKLNLLLVEFSPFQSVVFYISQFSSLRENALSIILLSRTYCRVVAWLYCKKVH